MKISLRGMDIGQAIAIAPCLEGSVRRRSEIREEWSEEGEEQGEEGDGKGEDK